MSENDGLYNFVGDPSGWVARTMDGRELAVKNSPIRVYRMSSLPTRIDRFIFNLFLLGNGVPISVVQNYWRQKFGALITTKMDEEVVAAKQRVGNRKYGRYWDVTAQSFADQIPTSNVDYRLDTVSRRLAGRGRIIQTVDGPATKPSKFRKPSLNVSKKGMPNNPYLRGRGNLNGPAKKIAVRANQSRPAKNIAVPRTVYIRNPYTNKYIRSPNVPTRMYRKINNPYSKKRAYAPLTPLESLRNQYHKKTF